MLQENLYSLFVGSYNDGDMKTATLSLMKELGNIFVRNKEDFVSLLNESGIPATMEMTDSNLVDLFIKNIGRSRKLVLGTSMLVNMHNKQTGFDGDEELSDIGVKGGYSAICSYFEDYSNAIDPVTAIAQGVGELAKVGGKISDAQQKKKYGMMDLAAKQKEAKAAMIQQILANKQVQIDAATKQKETKAKTTRLILIVGGAVLVVALIVGVVILNKGKKQ